MKLTGTPSNGLESLYYTKSLYKNQIQVHANQSPSSNSPTTNSGVCGEGGSRKDQIAAATMQNNELVIIQANPIQNPPRRSPSWKTVVMDKLATMLPTDWMISMTVYRRAVSSRSTRVVMIERVRKTKPDPDVWMIMLGMRVATEGRDRFLVCRG